MAFDSPLRPVPAFRPAWAALLVLAAAVWSPAWAGGPMLYGYEDPFGVLHLSDRRLNARYVAACPYDDRVKSLDFAALRKIVREKSSEKQAAAKSTGTFWTSDASTPRLLKPGGSFGSGSRLGGRAPDPAGHADARLGGWSAARRPGAPSRDVLRAIAVHSQKSQVDPHLVYALIEAESNFQPNVVSPKGAQGLMQIMPETGRQLGLLSPFDPEQNIEAGVRYLRLMLDKFGGLPLALAAYNAGPGCVELHGGVPPIPETRQYVARVLARYDNLRKDAVIEALAQPARRASNP